MVEKVSIKIRKDLYDKIKDEVDRSEGEFKSVEEYVEFILEELLREEEEEQVYTEEEEEEIKRRLRALGYIS
jgi:Arc/MetJ-type ribon-helix-helix transcriptional regulator